MDLGTFSISLAVRNLERSLEFYAKLGFEVIDGGHRSKDFPDSSEKRWRVLQNGSAKIGLFEGMFPRNILTFHPPDVLAIQRTLKQNGVSLMSEADENAPGPASLMFEDPDGNTFLFDQPM